MKKSGKRALMLVYNFTPGVVGGAELQAEQLAYQLARFGHQIAVMTNTPSVALHSYYYGSDIPFEHAPAEEVRTAIVEGVAQPETDIHIHRLPFDMAYHFDEGYLDTFRYLVVRRASYDILHCHMGFGQAVVATIVARIFRKRCVIKFACAGSDGELEIIKSFREYPRALRILHQADVVVAISREVQQELLANGFSKNRIVYIPNGVDTHKFHPLKDKAMADQKFRFILIGRRTPQKGVDTMLYAVDHLRSLGHLNKFEVHLYGIDYPEYNYKRLASELGLEGCVHFLSFQKDVLEVYRHAHALLLPSRGEGLSNALLEAMSAGLPVIATPVSGTLDVMVHGEHGLIIEPESPVALANAMLELISNPLRCEALGRNARKRVADHFSLESVAGQYSRLYESF